MGSYEEQMEHEIRLARVAHEFESQVTEQDVITYREYIAERQITRRDALARAVEDALAEYLGVDAFRESDWPNLAVAFADLIEKSDMQRGYLSAGEVVQNAREYTAALSTFVDRLTEHVE